MKTGEEIKKLIDANNATIEQILKPNQFTLNNIVAQLLNENKMLQAHCPKCLVLEQKLKAKNIKYEEVNDVGAMLDLGFKQAPILKVDNSFLAFADAVRWINEVEA